MTDPSVSEIAKVARAILDDIGNSNRLNLDDPYNRIITIQLSSADICGMAGAAIAALEQARAEKGLVLVPREPTNAMRKASTFEAAERDWPQMIAAYEQETKPK